MDPTTNAPYRTDCIFNSLERLTTVTMDWLFAPWATFRWTAFLFEYIWVSETSDEFSGETSDSVSEKVGTIDDAGSVGISATLEDVGMLTVVEVVGMLTAVEDVGMLTAVEDVGISVCEEINRLSVMYVELVRLIHCDESRE